VEFLPDSGHAVPYVIGLRASSNGPMGGDLIPEDSAFEGNFRFPDATNSERVPGKCP
jgi:hypothetical protein